MKIVGMMNEKEKKEMYEKIEHNFLTSV